MCRLIEVPPNIANQTSNRTRCKKLDFLHKMPILTKILLEIINNINHYFSISLSRITFDKLRSLQVVSTAWASTELEYEQNSTAAKISPWYLLIITPVPIQVCFFIDSYIQICLDPKTCRWWPYFLFSCPFTTMIHHLCTGSLIFLQLIHCLPN